MHDRPDSEPDGRGGRTTVERTSERELVVTRYVLAPARLVFQAWTRPELLKQWWVPQSCGMTLLTCTLDVRTGGRYRFEFGRDGAPGMAFFGRYIEVVDNVRLVWTNEETDDGAVSTLTFTETGDGTRLVLHEVYPTPQALDDALAGMEEGMPEQFVQLDALLATLAGQS